MKKHILGLVSLMLAMTCISCSQKKDENLNENDASISTETSTGTETSTTEESTEEMPTFNLDDYNFEEVEEEPEVFEMSELPDVTDVKVDLGTIVLNGTEINITTTVGEFANLTQLEYVPNSRAHGAIYETDFDAHGFRTSDDVIIYIEAVQDDLIIGDWDEESYKDYTIRSVRSDNLIGSETLSFSVAGISEGMTIKEVQSILGEGTTITGSINTYCAYENDTHFLLISFQKDAVTGLHVFVKM